MEANTWPKEDRSRQSYEIISQVDFINSNVTGMGCFFVFSFHFFEKLYKNNLDDLKVTLQTNRTAEEEENGVKKKNSNLEL